MSPLKLPLSMKEYLCPIMWHERKQTESSYSSKTIYFSLIFLFSHLKKKWHPVFCPEHPTKPKNVMKNKSQAHISLVPIYLSNYSHRNMKPCYCRSPPGQCFAWNWTLPVPLNVDGLASDTHTRTLTHTPRFSHAAPLFCSIHLRSIK